MITSHLILFLVWIIYCFLHSFLAVSRVKGWFQGKFNLTLAGYRIIYNCFAFISLLAVVILHFSIQTKYLFFPVFIKWYVGPALLFSGLVIMSACIRKYWQGLSGLNPNDKNKLITTGLHAYVRHPLYLGTFIFITGLFCIYPTYANLIGAMVIIIYTLIGMKLEEKKLESEFGSAYQEYKSKVPAIIPFINSKK
jgi:methanethiol S-methyltransferase